MTFKEIVERMFPFRNSGLHPSFRISLLISVLFLCTRHESIPKLVETRVTSGRSGCGMSLAIGMDDPEFLLNRGTERREVAIAE